MDLRIGVIEIANERERKRVNARIFALIVGIVNHRY
jgi:hypothetical protein